MVGAAACETIRVLRQIAPLWSGNLRLPLRDDESRWFNAAVREGIVSFSRCGPDCSIAIKRGVFADDHFNTSGGGRHLFSVPHRPSASLSREYIPHVAAYGRLVLGLGYDLRHSAFSRYRKYQRDLITKTRGGWYETDCEFYTPDGGLFVHVEAKREPKEVDEMAEAIDEFGRLTELPTHLIKEIEYVLDLAPRYLWLVGPGTVDPERHVFEVEVDGLRASFRRVPKLPPPP